MILKYSFCDIFKSHTIEVTIYEEPESFVDFNLIKKNSLENTLMFPLRRSWGKMRFMVWTYSDFQFKDSI